MQNTAEFTMLTDLVEATPKELSFNFDELKMWLSSSLDTYKGLIVTENDIPEAKAIKAKVNRVSKAINDQRIAVKKQYMQPYTEFESKCKELTGMCDEVANAIGEQLTYYDNLRKEQKIAEIKQFYDAKIINEPELAEYMPFARLVDPRWGNVTFTIDAAKIAILEKLEVVSGSLLAIKNMNSKHEAMLLSIYKRTLNLVDVMNAEAEANAKEDAIAKDKGKVVPKPVKKSDEKPVEWNICVTVTKQQKADLKAFLKENKIKTKQIL